MKRFAARLTRKLGLRTARPAPAAERFRIARQAGDAARNNSDWNGAAAHYEVALSIQSDRDLTVQYAHALKEGGRLGAAEQAYRAAIAMRPEEPETHLHLGHVLKLQGRSDQAIEAYVDALKHDPGYLPARNEIIAAGRRNSLPHQAYARSEATDRLSRISDLLTKVSEATSEWLTVSTYPTEAYHAFRKTYPILPPPPLPGSGPIARLLVLVDARQSSPWALRATLDSLKDQTAQGWRAVVRAPTALLDHPVASVCEQDQRMIFVSSDEDCLRLLELEADADMLVMDAGVCLDREAIGWLRLAAAKVDVDVVYCDHDHHVLHWRAGPTYIDPALQSGPDVDDMTTNPAIPVVVWTSRALRSQFQAGISRPGCSLRRDLILNALARRKIAHLPRILASVRVEAPVEDTGAPARKAENAAESDASSSGDRLLVIIPTRDGFDLIGPCVSSLNKLATRPGQIEFVILNNRSVRSETVAALDQIARLENVTVQAFDQPFNWSRMNNTGARLGNHAGIVFVNDDTEMLTRGWDEAIRTLLKTENVGVIGAKLLYPDLTIQHGGVMLGGDAGRPVHEGLDLPRNEAGPLARWRRRRGAAAVTGAFMAVSRTCFEQVGGFDENLQVGYNDIDFCLRVRALGLKVIYEPAIELIHFESKTRGFAKGSDAVLWDESELRDLYRRWGDQMFEDPGRNPHWVPAGRNAFDGFRDLSERQVLESLALSARANPWLVAASSD